MPPRHAGARPGSREDRPPRQESEAGRGAGAARAKAREPDSRSLAALAAQAALEKHAEGVVVMDLRGLSSVTDFFVLCTADNPRQVTAITEHVEAAIERGGAAVWHTEGPGSTARMADPGEALQWVLMDCGNVVVHVFDRRARAFYRLEELWADAPRVPVAGPVDPPAVR